LAPGTTGHLDYLQVAGTTGRTWRWEICDILTVLSRLRRFRCTDTGRLIYAMDHMDILYVLDAQAQGAVLEKHCINRESKPGSASLCLGAPVIAGGRLYGGMILEAAPGLGEAVVSGDVQPDHLRLDAATIAVITARCGGAVRMRPCVDAPLVETLWRHGRAITTLYQAPQDGRTWILQTRPITTLVVVAVMVPPRSTPPPPGHHPSACQQAIP
jgi:hypothetical protein